MNNQIDKLKQLIKEFRDERDWQQFHNPKDLSQALSIEASELSELFLWKSQEESYDVVKEKKEALSDEMADVFAYLLALSNVTGIDLEVALLNKLEKNKKKYPADEVKGSSKKYTEYKK